MKAQNLLLKCIQKNPEMRPSAKEIKNDEWIFLNTF